MPQKRAAVSNAVAPSCRLGSELLLGFARFKAPRQCSGATGMPKGLLAPQVLNAHAAIFGVALLQQIRDRDLDQTGQFDD